MCPGGLSHVQLWTRVRGEGNLGKNLQKFQGLGRQGSPCVLCKAALTAGSQDRGRAFRQRVPCSAAARRAQCHLLQRLTSGAMLVLPSGFISYGTGWFGSQNSLLGCQAGRAGAPFLPGRLVQVRLGLPKLALRAGRTGKAQGGWKTLTPFAHRFAKAWHGGGLG